MFDPYSERAERGLHFDYSCQGHLTNFYIVFQPGQVPKSGVPVPFSGKNLFPRMGRKTANAGLKSLASLTLAQLSSARLNSAQLGSSEMTHLNSVQVTPAQLILPELSSARLISILRARFISTQLRSTRIKSAKLI